MDERETVDREVTVDQLTTGDKPSIYFFGLVGAHAIRKDEMAVFMTDVLGRVVLMPPSAIKVINKPKVLDVDLDKYPEETAIQIMMKQGNSDEEILKYLTRRPPTEEQ